jgi:hypothetical protein
MDEVTHKWQAQLDLERAWARDWLQPVTNALFVLDYDLAQSLLQAAQTELRASGLPADVRESLEYSLAFTACHLGWQRDPTTWTKESFLEAMRYFDAPAQTAFGDRERLVRRFTICYHADSDAFQPLTHDEIVQLFKQLGTDADLNYVSHVIAGWAFQHHDIELLELAFAEQLINPSSSLGTAKWQRVNLMYHLLQGRATPQDVAETLKTIQIAPQLAEFMYMMWPECIAQGLIDSALETMLQSVRDKVEQDGRVPGPEPRSKSFRATGLE